MNNVKFDDYIVGRYIYIGSFNEGLILVRNRDRIYGFINKKGEEVIPCQYKDVDPFSEGLTGIIDTEGNFYYINKKGVKKVFNDTYYSSLELENKTISIKADKLIIRMN